MPFRKLSRAGARVLFGIVVVVTLAQPLPLRVDERPHHGAAVAQTPPRGVCGSNGGFYTDAQMFANHRAQLGLVATASWDFTPHDLGAGASVTLNDPLNINTHASNANDPWTTGIQNNWPAALNNIQFSSNTTPNGALTPRGANGLTFSTPGGNHLLSATVAADSLNIVCESPSSRKCQAIEIALISAGFIRVRVDYVDPNFGLLYQDEINVNVSPGQQVFLGMIKSRIVRVDIWNSSGSENLSSLTLYRRPHPLDVAGNNGDVDVNDLLAVILNWGPCPTPPALCPANVVNTGPSANRVDADDMLAIITHWGPTPDKQVCAGEDPSIGGCVTGAQCGLGICDNTGCTPSACICDGAPGQWICTDDCCGHCI